MPARLLVYTGKLKGKALALPPEGKVILGRSQHAHITIPDANLSRSHCAIAATGQGYRVEDMSSTNGTCVNGKRIDQALLREGDRIVLGETEMEFRVKGRFDDSETKMDLVPIGTPEPMSPTEAADMAHTRATAKPQAAQAQPQGRVTRVRFCDVCDVNVARRDMESGAAREIAGRMVCPACVSRLEGRNLDAAASIERVLDDLAAEVRREAGGS
ncbi:MAG: FHA domain-containing protein [Planctomycetota bacterium]|jgi:predicted component of type VI protein secretion system